MKSTVNDLDTRQLENLIKISKILSRNKSEYRTMITPIRLVNRIERQKQWCYFDEVYRLDSRV